jgi:4-amino-4-deoxy-L-arabinose transferase-like glycosyltransferase
MAEKYYKYALDIRIYIIAFSIVGLTNILSPPLDGHAWRQTLTLMISKNFQEISPNIFYPRTNIGGATEGIMATEFPIFNYTLSILYRIFGFQDWYGRLLNWTVCCIGLYYFYQTIKKLFNDKAAFFGTLAYMGSVTFIYARKTMPDSFSVSLVIIGTYFLLNFLEKSSWKMFLSGFILVTLGILSKIPALCYLSILVVPVLDKEINLRNKYKLIGALSISAILLIAWYFYWMPYLLETYKNQLIWPVSLQEGFQIFIKEIDQVHQQFKNAFFYYPLFALSLTGLALALIKLQPSIKLAIGLFTALFFLYIFKTGIVFPSHEYYIIPYTPLMAAGIGYLFSQIQIKTIVILPYFLLLMAPAYIRNLQQSFINKEKKYLLELGPLVDKYIPQDAKIMVNGDNLNPVLMYFAGRRGWTVNSDILLKEGWIKDYKAEGMQYILVDKHTLGDLLPYEIVGQDLHFIIYKP